MSTGYSEDTTEHTTPPFTEPEPGNSEQTLPPALGAETSPEVRGTTTIHDRVVERMAGRIAGDIDHVAGTAHRVLGMNTGGQHSERTPHVRAEVRGSTCSLQMHLSVQYPAPVAQVTDHVRHVVIDRLWELATVEARIVDITVTALRSPHADRREIR